MKPDPNQQGASGERLVSEGLAKLPFTYRQFDNLVVPVHPWSSQTTQIDHVVLSPVGVFVIETKKYAGRIFGSEHDSWWLQTLGNQRFPFRNPLHQNQHHVSVLIRQLGLPSPAFHPIVAFIGLAQFGSPLPSNVITTIAPGVPGLRRYIDQFTQPVLSTQQLFTAAAKLIELKNNGLTVEDHVRSIRNRDLGRRLDEAMRLRQIAQGGN